MDNTNCQFSLCEVVSFVINSVSCVCVKVLLVALRYVCLLQIDFHRLGCRRGDRCSSQYALGGSGVGAGGDWGAHRRQDGQRAAIGARAQRLGADARPPAEATLGPALLLAPPRGARRRCQTRHHIPEGSRYPQQTHTGKVPKAER